GSAAPSMLIASADANIKPAAILESLTFISLSSGQKGVPHQGKQENRAIYSTARFPDGVRESLINSSRLPKPAPA
ncbi:MAG: hypothetical protein ACREV0_07540, partial [Burkholderiales bacterium]